MIKYDVILDEYSVVASMPAPRSNFASALLGGRGYVIGGFETANTAARSLPKVSSCCSRLVLRSYADHAWRWSDLHVFHHPSRPSQIVAKHSTS